MKEVENMKIQNNISMRNGRSHMIKQANWNSGDITIELNACQFGSDEFNDEPQGDIEYKSYRPEQITDAFKAFLQYVEKGYESIELSIYSYISEDATFTIRIQPKEIIPWSTTDITASDENAEKLAKIQQIIQSNIKKNE